MGDAIALSKVERHTIDAIAQAMGRWAIRKHMTQVTLAMAADQLNPSHLVCRLLLEKKNHNAIIDVSLKWYRRFKPATLISDHWHKNKNFNLT